MKTVQVYIAKATYKDQYSSLEENEEFTLGNFWSNGRLTINYTNKGPIPLDFIVNFCKYLHHKDVEEI